MALTTDLVLNRVMPLIDETPHLKAAYLAAHLSSAAGDGAGLDHARRPRRHAGVSAIHVRLDRHAEGRGPEPRQSGSQLGADLAFVRAHPLGHGRVLAAELSRHGADRRHLAAALHRAAERVDVADELLAEAVPLAVGHHALPRHHQRRAELRLRPVRPQDHARAAEDPRLEQLAGGVQRGGAGPAGDAGCVCRGVCAVRLPPRGVFPLFRPGRGDVDRLRRLCPGAAGGPRVRRRRAGPRRGDRRRPGRRGRAGVGGLRPEPARPEDRHCRSRDAYRLSARPGRRNLGAGAKRGPRATGNSRRRRSGRSAPA